MRDIDSGCVRVVLSGEAMPYRERTGVNWDARKIWSHRETPLKRYQDWLRNAAQEAMGERRPIDGPVIMILFAYMPIPKTTLRKHERVLAEQERLPHGKKPDMTQLLKAAEDPFKSVVWTDDSRIACHFLLKLYSPRPRLEIEVWPWSIPKLHEVAAVLDGRVQSDLFKSLPSAAGPKRAA